MVRRPLFTVFEGIDGSGTTTQIDLLMGRLDALGINAVRSREPGGTPLSERIRDLVLDRSLEDVHPVTESLLCAASRSQHVRLLIAPALVAGKPVICDRYADSTAAYQGGGRGLDMELIHQLNEVAMAGCVPDVTVYIDVTVDEGERRRRLRQGAPDRFEEAGRAFQERVREAYRQIASRNTGGKVWVDGVGQPELVSETIYRELRSLWPHFPFSQ